MAYKKITRKS